MLWETVKKYYFQDYNCAEALLLGAGEEYNLNITQEELKLVGGFGGGNGCGGACGALSGALAAFGKMNIKTQKARDTQGFKEACSEITADFENQLGGSCCKELTQKYRTEEEKCLKVVLAAATALKNQVEIYGK